MLTASDLWVNLETSFLMTAAMSCCPGLFFGLINHRLALPDFGLGLNSPLGLMLIRLILLLVVVTAVLWLLKRLFGPAPPPEKLESRASENMRQCKYCGTHVPESLAIITNGQPYCSQDHAERDQP